MKNLNLQFIGLLVVFVILVVFPKKALAGELSLGIYPPIIQVIAQPPAKIDTPITIQNLGDEALSLNIILRPFTASQTDGQPSYLSQNDFFGENPLFFQNVQIQEAQNPIQSLNLSPKQEKKLNLHIEIPKDESQSEYYFSVLFISTGTKPSAGNQSQSMAGIGTNVLLSLGPKRETKGTLKEFSAPFFSKKGPLPFTVRVENTSDHFITPKGRILIKNMFGQTVGDLNLLPQNILRKTERTLTTEGASKAFWMEKFLLGIYTANLTLYLSDNGPRFERSIHFVGMPIQIAIGILIAAFILLFIRNRLKSLRI